MAEGATVLIVDDDAGMRFTLDRILRLQGFRVLVADGSAGALEVARQEPLDFALVDYRMSGTNGGEVCATLAALRPEATVYMMTAHVSPEAAESAVANGAAGILYKPLDIPAVLALVDEHQQRRAPTTSPGGGA